ncbi:MAG TPA: hypothetical protein VJY42_02110 [Candidatus Methanomethylophilaceae archaeon]|nr:hypothetical protein [Candidatus Methanomethylophilaceae archaeon]
MASVIVDMAFCSKTHKVTVKLKEDGDLSVHIATNCDHIKEYAKNLGDTLTIQDVTDWSGSKVYNEAVCKPASITCLVPAGIMNAAWLELGMLSKSRAREIQANCVRFVKKDETKLIDE